MGRLRGFLERFRPTGVPAAARAGVPADRAAEDRAELAGVFAAMEPVQAECREIRDAAERAAHDVRRRAGEEATALLGAARARAQAERAVASVTAGRSAATERDVIVADAERRAATIRDRADERLPALVTRAVEMVKAMTGG
ncbi:hypothetical protein [Actinoallomurus rhizosphaericola]|uniref:hypothetical protein n=1 Tax=Actinoallomurus rhizosphaericola TaxID=2952536 RepID=UPI002093FED4|nr:hypothetical protein [Actinoallomurus rhizosphaericola]MCO5995545.1 hypothetical protein [Actinoallomurus rhizosphaericola]